MDKLQALQRLPHLASPAALATADSGGKWRGPPHLKAINAALVRAWGTPNSRLAVSVPFQHGKLLTHDTPVWTECGWKSHGELAVGDYVYSPSGAAVEVQAISEDGLADYEVVFSNGSVIQCHGAHEWYVYERTKHKWAVVETEYLASTKLRYRNQYNVSVPRINPLITADETLLLHPYALGAWLGDGNSERSMLSHGGDDWEVVNGIVACGYKNDRRWLNKTNGSYWSQFKDMLSGLMAYALLNNKHIPEVYLQASIEQRLDLLAGLIDTDGNYSEESGQYRFTNTNKRLIDQTAFLATTLGFKVGKIQEYEPTLSSSGIQGKETAYVVVFSPTRTIPCRIPRKQTKRLSEACRLAIVEVRKTDPKPGRCIQVEGGLYLVGESLIPTHNSVLCSNYFPAWVLLLWPETRIALASYSDEYAAKQGAAVRDIVSRYGPALGVSLREDTRAKDEWVVDFSGGDRTTWFGGGMVCKGRGGALTGRPADLLILDDMIKNSEEAQSPAVLDGLWDWYCTVAFSRLGPTAPVISVSTRWGPKDLVGRWESEAKVGGEQFEHVVFTAIAEKGDILGRRPGEALWPERVPLARLEMVKKRRPRWFEACWQGNPVEGVGLHFQPKNWPKYVDTGDAWRVKIGFHYHSYRKAECVALIAIDWAQRGKKDSDKTAFVAAALTPDGHVLVLDVLNEQMRQEGNAPALAAWCQRWRWGEIAGLIVASDDDMLSEAMVIACRQHRAIPDIKRLGIRSRSKLIRAQAAIIRSQDSKFLLPEADEPWYAEFEEQLRTFTGAEGAEDDIVDCVGILGRLANDWYPAEEYEEDYEPLLGSAGYLPAF